MFFCPSHSAMRGPTPLTYLTGVVRSNIYVASLQTARAIRPAPDPSAPDARRSARPGLPPRHAKIARVGGPGLAAISQIITDRPHRRERRPDDGYAWHSFSTRSV